jgi:starch phosphorylase
VEQHWRGIRFGPVKTDTKDGQHIFEVQLYLGDLTSDAVRVQLYANGADSDHAFCQEMKCTGQPEGTGCHVYAAQVPATRPAADYTARLIPRHEGVAIPLEVANILWQR